MAKKMTPNQNKKSSGRGSKSGKSSRASKPEKVYINRWYPRDEKVFNKFANSPILSRQDLHEHVKDKRIRDYEREGYVEKCLDRRTESEYFKLTDKGRDLCKEKYDREPGVFHSYKHENGIRELYNTLNEDTKRDVMSELEIQETAVRYWKACQTSGNEDIRQRGYEMEHAYKRGDISTCDFGVLKVNFETLEIEQAEFYEVITPSYTKGDISAKHEFANSFGGSITTSTVR